MIGIKRFNKRKSAPKIKAGKWCKVKQTPVGSYTCKQCAFNLDLADLVTDKIWCDKTAKGRRN